MGTRQAPALGVRRRVRKAAGPIAIAGRPRLRGAAIVVAAVIGGGCGTTNHSACPAVPMTLTDPFGANPDPLSALRNSELVLSGDIAAVVKGHSESQDEDPQSDRDLNTTEWAMSGDLVIRGVLADPSGAAVTGFVGITGAIDDARGQVSQAGYGGVALRYVKEIGEPSAPTHRRGISARLDVARGGDGSDVTRLRPLDEFRLGGDDFWQVLGELRYELAGCYAPFVHLTAGVRVPAGDDHVYPISILVGAHPEIRESIVIFGGYDREMASYQGRDLPAAPHRVRFGIEAMDWASAGLRLGVVTDLVLGDVDGAYLGGYLSLPLGSEP